MAATNKTTLKGYFNTGDTPTEAQFANLIDSSPNIVDDFADQYVKVSLSAAQILASNSSPPELIATPGAGKMIAITKIVEKLNYVSSTYATNTTTVIEYGTSVISAVTSLGLNQTEDYIYSAAAEILNTISSEIENNNVVFKTNSGDPTTGDGTIDIYIWYKEVTL